MNTRISWKTDKIIFLILLGLVFLSHLPFLESDPDRNMSVGRGPFTDEGLNTIQIRNWVNQGYLSLSECDNLLKTPLFGFPLALTYKIFGTSHMVSRLHVLTLVILSLLLIGMQGKNTRWMIIFLLISLLQYQVFQSSHFSMAEMLSVASILLALELTARSSDPQHTQKSRDIKSFLAALFISFSYFIKIQFIYIIVLLPVILLIRWFTTNYFARRLILRQGFIMTATLLFFLLVYLLAWYLPHKEAYDYMMAGQSGELSLSSKTWEYIRFNLAYHFFQGWLQWFIYLFLLLIIPGFYFLKKSKSIRYPVLFISSLVWFLLELHKLTMVYLPTRYQVSTLVSMGLIMSLVLNELLSLKWNVKSSFLKLSAVAAIAIITGINLYNYFDTLQHRTYEIRNANDYLAQNLNKEDVVLGAWAPSLTWKSGSRALPVWNHFLNYKDAVQKYNPSVIIAEYDEQDSEQAWKSQGIDLNMISDPVKTVRIGHWDVVIYRLK